MLQNKDKISTILLHCHDNAPDIYGFAMFKFKTNTIRYILTMFRSNIGQFRVEGIFVFINLQFNELSTVYMLLPL